MARRYSAGPGVCKATGVCARARARACTCVCSSPKFLTQHPGAKLFKCRPIPYHTPLKHSLNCYRYFLLRIEDLALGDPAPVLKRLVQFLNLPESTPAELAVLVAKCQGHERSYGGAKYTKEQRAGYINDIQDAGRSAFKTFGYRLDDWGIATSAPVVRWAS